MQTQRHVWQFCQQYNVVKIVVSFCLILIAVCGLSDSESVTQAHMGDSATKTSLGCAESDYTHVVVEGDTLARLATSYGLDEQRVAAHNAMLDSHALSIGQLICIQNVHIDGNGGDAFNSHWHSLRAPTGVGTRMRLLRPGTRRPAQVKKAASSPAALTLHIDRANGAWPHVSDGYAFRNLLAGSYGFVNVFAYGQCTWWATQRYFQLHSIVVPWRSQANAGQWIARAYENGWRVSGIPNVGSILVLQGGVQGAAALGHVGIVEQVLNDGTVIASSMNWGYAGGSISFDAFRPGPGVAFVDQY